MATGPADETFVERLADVAAWSARKSSFLFGPRQTGKSTLVRRRLPGARIYDLLDSSVFLQLGQQPGRLAEELGPRGGVCVIDEIQRLPELLNEVHRLIEERGIRFVLTGSSARKLRRGGVNLLGGRARTHHLYPLSYRELGTRFDLARAVVARPAALDLLLGRSGGGPPGLRGHLSAAGDRRGGLDPQRPGLQPVPEGRGAVQRDSRQLHAAGERRAGGTHHGLRVLRDPARHAAAARGARLDRLAHPQASRLLEVLLLRRGCRFFALQGRSREAQARRSSVPPFETYLAARARLSAADYAGGSADHTLACRRPASRWTSSSTSTRRSRSRPRPTSLRGSSRSLDAILEEKRIKLRSLRQPGASAQRGLRLITIVPWREFLDALRAARTHAEAGPRAHASLLAAA